MQVLSKARYACQKGVILLPLKGSNTYFILLLTNYRAIFDTSTKQSEAQVLKGCVKNCSIVKLYNKVLIISHLLLHIKIRKKLQFSVKSIIFLLILEDFVCALMLWCCLASIRKRSNDVWFFKPQSF